MPKGRVLLTGLVALCSSFVWAGSPVTAATPPAGSVGPSSPRASWSGPVVPASVIEPAGCSAPTAVCDTFGLTVEVDRSYWDSHFGGVAIAVQWDEPADHFQIRVEDTTGTVVAESGELPPRTGQSVTIPSAVGQYRVIVEYYAVTNAGYTGTAEFTSAEGAAPSKGRGAFFDASGEISFGPATVVSAHFLGAEPNVTIERPVAGAPPEVTDPTRIYVDWPLSTRLGTSQLSRSEDGGETFRLLFDPACAQRSRPNCGTEGGGDSFTAVNPWDGTLYFTDQEGAAAGGAALPLHEAVASSTDHGDTFPPDRQWATTNTALVLDRQWLETTDPTTTSVGPRGISAFLAYHVPGGGQYVQGIDEDGLPIPQPAPQLTIVGQSGPLRVDSTGGPGDGWIYQPYLDTAFEVATARVEDYQDPSAWQVNKVTDDLSEKFPWLDLDDKGNAYAVWVEGGVVYFSSSPIDDPRNNPMTGGRPGSYWSPLLRVSLPSITSAYFGEVAAGGLGRIAITYMGTKDHKGTAPTAGSNVRWNTYAAVVTNALGVNSPPIVHTGLVSPRIGHAGNIDGTDMTLLDFIDVGVTAEGRIGISFMDNFSTFAAPDEPAPGEDPPPPVVRPFAHYAAQTSGPGLFETPLEPVVVPTGARGAAFGDAKWPNVANGELLPSLDLLGASLSLAGGKLVARVPLGEGATDQMELDLDSFNSVVSTAPPAARLQYMVRFSTASDVYHLSAEFGEGGSLRFFGGRLDANDRIANVQSETIVGAAYNTDESFHVTGRLENNTLVLEAPATEFTVAPGDRLFGVTAFSTAGPAEEDVTLTDMMRTVDATPPFDAQLADPAAASPTPPPLSPNDLHVFAFPEEARREVGELQEVTATVTNVEGEPVPGAIVEWRTEGAGSIESSDARTDGDGRARAFLTSAEPGDQRAIVEAAGCGQVEPCFGAVAVTWNAPGCDLTGTPGADTLRGTSSDEVICGLGGNDKIKGGRGSDVVRGGPGRDVLRGEAGADAVLGGRGRDRLGGGGRRDRIAGGAGRDRAIGGAGNDRLHGGRGGDGLEGRRGNDSIDGGPGRDRVRGGRGRDDLRGGTGRDELFGGRGRDRCRPGSARRALRC